MFGKQRSDIKIPSIRIDESVYRKILGYVSLCPEEISALGTVTIRDDVICIDNIYLFDQVVSASSTDLSSEDISKFMYELLKIGKDTSTLKFWWHSHVNMGVFWSATDTGTIDRFNSGWLVSMVSNKQGEFKVRLDLFEPFRMTFDDLPISIDYSKLPYDPAIKSEIDVKVKSRYPLFDAFRDQFSDRNFHDRRIQEQFGNRSDPFTDVGVDEVRYGGERRYHTMDTVKRNEEKPILRDGKVIRGRDDPVIIVNEIIPEPRIPLQKDTVNEPFIKKDLPVNEPVIVSDDNTPPGKEKIEKACHSIFGFKLRF